MDVQTAAVVITGVSIIIGIILSLHSQKHALETRQAQLFMDVYNRWNTREIQIAYGNERFLILPQIQSFEDYQRLVLDERAKGNLDPWFYGQILITYFEGLGMLVKQGLINIDTVEDLFAGRIIWFWDSFGWICEMRRKQLGDPKLYDSIEYLYDVMKQRQATIST
ncbi:MAG: hypothetical protein NWE83_06195 [Candidatus Bathyarchaeota archaeon]|nr:hypothetical protein [Candidatus Bathyarchaeota archaeon]